MEALLTFAALARARATGAQETSLTRMSGKYKLDWIFVRAGSLSDPHDAKQPYRFAPHFGRTLKELNQSIPDRISDHSPITVDLPLGEPPILQMANL
jgi:hypothetical protein